MYLTKTSKSPYFQLVYFIDGKRTTISTKTKNREQSVRFLKRFIPSNKENLIKISNITLEQFRNEYEKHISLSKSQSYLSSVKLSFRKLIEYTQNQDLAILKPRLLDQFITFSFNRTEHGAALFYRTLKAAFSKAVLWNYIEANPWSKIKSPNMRKSFPVFISEKELNQIIANTNNQLYKSVFLTAFYTGMRRGEIMNLKWKWINIEERIITVKVDKSFSTKNKMERKIPVSSKIYHILSRPLDANLNDFVFNRFSEVKLNGNFISKQF